MPILSVTEGRFYMTGDGYLSGPMEYCAETSPYVWRDPIRGLHYTNEGRFLTFSSNLCDLVEEVDNNVPYI